MQPELARAIPGLYVSGARLEKAKALQTDQPVFVDERLMDDDWYLVTEGVRTEEELVAVRSHMAQKD